MRIRRLLIPFSFLYGLILLIRRRLYYYKIIAQYKPPLPTICIGNLCLGGSGKTPHTEYLINLLAGKSKCATLSRGYGRKSKGFLEAKYPSNIDASLIGDEPMLYRRKYPEIKVAVSEKRETGIKKLIEAYPDLDLILLDDAYQHLMVDAGLKILLTEFRNPYFQDYPIPAGNLREFRTAAKYADIIIVSKSPETLTNEKIIQFSSKFALKPHQHLFYTIYIYRNPVPQTENARKQVLDEKSKVILLTGIAHPEPLVQFLSSKYQIIHQLTYPDHYYYTKKEIEKLKKLLTDEPNSTPVVFTTEKDMMRLEVVDGSSGIESLPIFTVPVNVKFLQEGEACFNQIIESYVRKNKRNR